MIRDTTSNVYIADGQSDTYFYDKSIGCNETDDTACFVGCYGRHLCDSTRIELEGASNVEALQVLCRSQNSCLDMKIETASAALQTVQLLCDDGLACDDVSVSVTAVSSIELSIECNSSFACRGLSVHIYADDIGAQSELDVNISCYDDNACKGITISTNHSKGTRIALNMYKHSEDVQIHHDRPQQAKCNGFGDERYI